eukprot:TRINITY_DN15324_c0_g1_i1.p1 TRINITY_DN15324_c0_g1~~TRINITY_DN15324_c0_g1_i1.p1  ORF type:complete len:416 (-),score=137.93 TRINITY_DN15324_c0_g1_i1:48-1295(-)
MSGGYRQPYYGGPQGDVLYPSDLRAPMREMDGNASQGGPGDLSRYREEQRFLQRLRHLREDAIDRDNRIRELEARCNAGSHENMRMMQENAEIKDRISLMTTRENTRMKEAEDRLREVLHLAVAEEEEHKSRMEQIAHDQFNMMGQLNREWQTRFQRLEDHFRFLRAGKDKLLEEIRLANEARLKTQMDQEEAIRQHENRTHEEENRKYVLATRQYEAKIREEQDKKTHLNSRISENIRNIQFNEEQLKDRYLELEKQVEDANNDRIQIRSQMSKAMVEIDRVRCDFLQMENRAAQIKHETESLRNQLARQVEKQTLEVESQVFENNMERKAWEEMKEGLQDRLLELDRASKIAQNELSKVRADYQRLKDLLQANVNREIANIVHRFNPVLHQRRMMIRREDELALPPPVPIRLM